MATDTTAPEVGLFTLTATGTHEQIAASIEYALDRFSRGSNHEPLLDMLDPNRAEIGWWRFEESASGPFDRVNAALRELWNVAEEAGLMVLCNDDEADDGSPQIVLTLEGRWPDGK